MRSLATGLIAAFVLSGVAVAADPGTPAKNAQCFHISNFEGWKAPDAKTIYIRVGQRNYYRLDLTASCPTLRWPSAYLVTEWRGSSWVCSAIDWDLKVAQRSGGFAQPCLVKTMTKLTPAEAEAIPKKFKP